MDPQQPKPPIPGAGATGKPFQVVSIVHETCDAVSVVLRDVTGTPVTFEPGQFFLVHVEIDGEVLRRTYSATNAPGEFDGGLRLTIKRRSGGCVSIYMNERLREGDTLMLRGPSGRFVPSSANAPRHLVLIAGGSGITPMMCMSRTLLPREAYTRITLIYGNRNLQNTIFRDEFDALVAAYPDRLSVRHILAEPPEGWAGPVGLMTAEVLGSVLRSVPAAEEYFLCGSEQMMDAARGALAGIGVTEGKIRVETFKLPERKDKAGAER